MASKITPKKLYRFRSATTSHFRDELKQAVLLHKVWCSPVDCQNDPFEALPVFVDSPIHEMKTLLALIRERHGANTTFSGSDMLSLAKSRGLNKRQRSEVLKLSENIPLQRKAAKKSFLHQRKSIKIAAFCGNSESLLLWAHYADSHRGVRLNYTWEENNNSSYRYPKLVSVKYTKNRPVLSSTDIAKYICGGNLGDHEIASEKFTDEVLEKSILTKSHDWRYEDEWRLVVINEAAAGYSITLPLKVTSITCGASASRDTISSCLKTAGDEIPIYQSKLSDSHFGLQEQQIN